MIDIDQLAAAVAPALFDLPAAPVVDLNAYHRPIINSSAGKDSLAMMLRVREVACLIGQVRSAVWP